MCDKFANDFNNVRVIHQENAGPSKARNAGIDIANGKFVTFVDSDDFVHPAYLEFLKSEIDQNNVLLSICGYQKTSISLPFKCDKSLLSDTVKVNNSEAFELLLNNQELCAPWAKLYNIILFKNLRFPVDILYEDMFFTPQIFKKARQISISFNKLYYYNQEGISITRSSYNSLKITQYFEASQFWVSFAKTNYPEHSEKARDHFYRNILNLCKEIRLDKNEEVIELYLKYKSLVLNSSLELLTSKSFPSKEKIKLILLKLNYY
jgi:glycosyltransferase involved in cell wall biosynthesis